MKSNRAVYYNKFDSKALNATPLCETELWYKIKTVKQKNLKQLFPKELNL